MNVQWGEAERLLSEAESGACQFVDFQFTDVAGALKSVVLPASQLRETLEFGHWFDGSALEGAARTMETDLLLRPDLRTWGILPWPGPRGELTGRMLCDVQTPEGAPFPADPRAVLHRAVLDAAELGFAYQVASEVEFFLFRSPIPADDGPRGASPTPAHPVDRGGYFDQPVQEDSRVRDEVVQVLMALGVPVEASHHEIGPGQQEIDLPLLTAVAAADAIVT
ncbi:MAG: glutamine synthetase beta-grasp domain-containing protein, partial [Chloroflexota bacterium]